MEPAEPIDRMEPAEPTDKIEPAEPIERREPADPVLAGDWEYLGSMAIGSAFQPPEVGDSPPVRCAHTMR
jgi:hypothetical protein